MSRVKTHEQIRQDLDIPNKMYAMRKFVDQFLSEFQANKAKQDKTSSKIKQAYKNRLILR